MRKLTSSLALFLAAASLAMAAPSPAEPTVPSSLVQVTKTDIPNEALIRVARLDQCQRR